MTFPFWYSSLFFLELRIVSLFHLLWVCFWTCSLTFHTLQQACLYFIYKFLLFDMVKLSDKFFLSSSLFSSHPTTTPLLENLRKSSFLLSSWLSLHRSPCAAQLPCWAFSCESPTLLFWFGLPISGAHVIVFLDLERYIFPYLLRKDMWMIL